MNKEFIYKTMEEVEVKDAYGREIDRKTNNNDMETILKLENNIEKLCEIISSSKKEIDSQKERIKEIKESDKMIIILSTIFFIFITTVFTVATFPIIIAILATTLFAGCYSGILYLNSYLAKRSRIKEINALEKLIKKANEIKEKYENKLKKVKSRKLITKEELIKIKELIELHKVISLEESMELPKEDVEEINEAYDLGYNENVRRLKRH